MIITFKNFWFPSYLQICESNRPGPAQLFCFAMSSAAGLTLDTAIIHVNPRAKEEYIYTKQEAAKNPGLLIPCSLFADYWN